jgi:hypothetical protein
VSGGAIGAAGTLMAQWVVRKLGGDVGVPVSPPSIGGRDLELLRMEVSDLGRQVENMDARLEFQEQLLGGSLQTSAPPPRLQRGDDSTEEDGPPPG